MFTRLPGFPRRTFLLAVLMCLFLFAGAQAALAVAPDFEQVADVPFQYLSSVVAADVDGDGYDDLITTNGGRTFSDSCFLAVSINNGSGIFQTPVLYNVGALFYSAPHQFTVADLNGDGNLDAAVAIQNDNCINVLLGNGDGTFQAAQTFGAGMSLPQDVAAGDFNGDGVTDLAVAKYNTDTVAVLFGTGSGSAYSLGAPVYYSTGAGSYSITAGDFDGDNDLDLAVSNYSEYHLSILLNNGTGVFGTPSNYAVLCITEVICDDFNADGNPDLAAGGRDGVYVLTGNGDGTFASPVCYGSNSYYKSVTAGDFNGDNLIDLAALINRKEPSFIEPKLGVLTGNGDGTFQTEVTWYITPTDVYNQFFEGTLASGDFNNDGKPDLAAANWDDIKTVSLLLNTTPSAPTVTSVTVPANGTYVAGQNLDFAVNFNEAVTVNTSGGTPYIPITLDTGGTVNASYLSGSGTASLLFRYTIQPADMGSVTIGTLQAGGGTVKEAGGIDADLTLNNVGDTSNILVSQDIVLTSPGGGETWAAGSSQTISWNYTGSPGAAVRIELLKGGVLDRVISYGAYTGSNCSGSYIWSIPTGQAPGSEYTIRVTSILDSNYTFTSGAFTITLPLATSITVSSPNGGEIWAAGSSRTISWNYNGHPGDLVRVELLKNGSAAKVINSGTYIGLNGSGSCQWTVPSGQAAGSDYQVRVTSNLNSIYTDTNDNTFTITGPAVPAITISSPNGGESWATGGSQTISWNYTGNIGQTVKVELLKNGALDRVISYSTFTGSKGGGSCQWTIPAGLTPGIDYQVRVTTTGGIYTDTSDSTFTVTGPAAPAIVVVAPNGGETWATGSSQTIRWSYTGNPGYLVKIELLKNGALSRVITYGAPIGSGGRGTYRWTVPRGTAAGGDYKIRVTSFSDSACTDTSDTAFSIIPAP